MPVDATTILGRTTIEFHREAPLSWLGCSAMWGHHYDLILGEKPPFIPPTGVTLTRWGDKPSACGEFQSLALYRQYVTDAAGHQTGVILPLGEYTELLEDLDDLATVAERC